MTMQLVLPSGVTLVPAGTPAQPADLPPHVLERIALHWAERAGVPPGRVRMDEEELGWRVHAPGATTGYLTLVDKVTGRVVSFANPTYLSRQYREMLRYEDGAPPRPGFGGLQVETPGVVAEVSVGSAPGVQVGSVRSDEPPALHPLVRARLDRIPARARVRGAEHHPELAALSRAGAASADVHVTLWRIREPADPGQGSSRLSPCVTCTEVLGLRAHFPSAPPAAISRWARHRARRRVHHHRPPAPATVAERIEQVLAVRGVEHGHAVFPAAVVALERYLDARWGVEVPGRSVRTTAFTIDPARVADTADTLARLARRIGAPLFPLGTAGQANLLAIDAGQRVFLVDDAGEWALGKGLPRALDTLMLGRRASRVRDPR